MSYSDAENNNTTLTINDDVARPEEEVTARPLKKRKHINDAQRQAMRRYAGQWAARNGKRTPHTHLREWFEATYGWSIAMSIVTFIMSDKFTYLDTDELARPDAKRSVAPNWPDLEAALWDWQQHYEAIHTVKINSDALREQAQQLWSSMDIYKDKVMPNFSSGWVTGYRERHGASTKRKSREGPAPAKNVSLTEWLSSQDLPGLRKACHESNFLALLGQGHLSAATASAFLHQERLKSLSEIKYLGGLLTKLPLTISSLSCKHHSRILPTIIEEINSLHARLRLIDDTLPLYTTLLHEPSPITNPQPTPQTSAYTSLLTPSPSTPLLPSLVLYWTIRKLHYTAFTTASLTASSTQTVAEKNRAQNDPNYDPLAADIDSGILRRWILPHFIAEDVGARVHKLGGLLNSIIMESKEKGGGNNNNNNNDISMATEERLLCEQLWRQALWVVAAQWSSISVKVNTNMRSNHHYHHHQQENGDVKGEHTAEVGDRGEEDEMNPQKQIARTYTSGSGPGSGSGANGARSGGGSSSPSSSRGGGGGIVAKRGRGRPRGSGRGGGSANSRNKNSTTSTAYGGGGGGEDGGYTDNEAFARQLRAVIG